MTLNKLKTLPPLYKGIMDIFPQRISFCFAYGSGVKKQLFNNNPNMIDLIIAVKDPVSWHQENMSKNYSHYSGLRYMGHEFISHYQKSFGAKVYFNTLVPVEEQLIKYGVVSSEDLITDLLEWSDLYLAGRLHKPVEILKGVVDGELQTALQLNLQSAVHAALLILPESFSEYQFYCTISNLSYLGDFRMIFGENKNKVNNIVSAQMISFRNLYAPLLKNLHDYVEIPALNTPDKPHDNKSSNCAQDISPLAKLHHLNQLPRWPQKALARYWNKGNYRQDTEDVLRAVAYDPDCGSIVNRVINNIVWKSSVNQSLKGILTAGLSKSIKYSGRKIKKMF